MSTAQGLLYWLTSNDHTNLFSTGKFFLPRYQCCPSVCQSIRCTYRLKYLSNYLLIDGAQRINPSDCDDPPACYLHLFLLMDCKKLLVSTLSSLTEQLACLQTLSFNPGTVMFCFCVQVVEKEEVDVCKAFDNKYNAVIHTHLAQR